MLFLVSLLLIVPLFAVRRRANEEAVALGVRVAVAAGAEPDQAAEARHPGGGDAGRAGAHDLHDR